MPNLVVPIGLPGCGKSTFAKSLLDLKYAVVSTDATRIEVAGSLEAFWDIPADDRPNVFDMAHAKTRDYLLHGVDVFFDATNLWRTARETLRAIAKDTDSALVGLLFNNYDEAIYRNSRRTGASAVPDDVMQKMMEDFRDTRRDILQEHFDTLIRIESVK